MAKNPKASGKADTPSFKREMLGLLPSLRAFAVSLCGRTDQADDLVQDTVLKAWAAQDRFEPGTNMRAWLFTILRNEYYNTLRKSGREIQDTEGYFTAQMTEPAAQLSVLELQDFQKQLLKLPDDQREALLLVGASGFSYEEAAEICQCAPGTIKSRVSRARSRLLQLMEPDDSLGPDNRVSTPDSADVRSP